MYAIVHKVQLNLAYYLKFVVPPPSYQFSETESLFHRGDSAGQMFPVLVDIALVCIFIHQLIVGVILLADSTAFGCAVVPSMAFVMSFAVYVRVKLRPQFLWMSYGGDDTQFAEYQGDRSSFRPPGLSDKKFIPTA
jgi:hypothetical protein